MGYRDELVGEAIPFSARIVAVADAYDVMTSARSYKKGLPAEVARQEIAACSGTQFDPDVVRSFLNVSLGDLRSAAGEGRNRGVIDEPRPIIRPHCWCSSEPPPAEEPPPPAVAFAESPRFVDGPPVSTIEDESTLASIAFSGDGLILTIISGPSNGAVRFD